MPDIERREKQLHDKRLDRIEGKIDLLSEAMVQLARTEEKILNIQERSKENSERIDALSGKVYNLKERVNENANTVTIINKLAWVTTISVVGGFIKLMWFTT